MLERPKCQTARGIPLWHPACTNDMNNIPWLQPFEVVYVSNLLPSGRRFMPWPEQESIKWMINPVAELSGPGDVVVSFCGRTMKMARASMVLCYHLHFVKQEKDECCVKEAIPRLLEVYARLVLRSDIDSTANGVIRHVVSVLFAEMERIAVQMKKDTWSAPNGMLPVQSFPHHAFQPLSSNFQDVSLYLRHSHIPLHHWWTLWQAGLTKHVWKRC